MKICRLCGEQKEIIDFQKHRAVCKSCRKLQQTKWRQDHQKQVNQTQLDWTSRNKDKSRITKLKWNQKNSGYYSQYKRIWSDKNRELVRAQCSARRKRVQQNTPPWADKQKIVEIYRNCPIGYHVDHIIPLRGKNVSGLHVETNLQYLPVNDNLRKGNRFETEC